VGGEITTRYPWGGPFQEGVRVARYRPRGGGHEQAICEVIFYTSFLGEANIMIYDELTRFLYHIRFLILVGAEGVRCCFMVAQVAGYL